MTALRSVHTGCRRQDIGPAEHLCGMGISAVQTQRWDVRGQTYHAHAARCSALDRCACACTFRAQLPISTASGRAPATLLGPIGPISEKGNLQSSKVTGTQWGITASPVSAQGLGCARFFRGSSLQAAWGRGFGSARYRWRRANVKNRGGRRDASSSP